MSLQLTVDIRLVFDTFQEASYVIGQPDLESSGGSRDPTINSLFEPQGTPTVSGGRLWIPDPRRHRFLGFDGVPTSNQPDASWVAGQADFENNISGTSATTFRYPVMGLEHEGYFYMLENGNNRVSIFDHTPPVQASAVIGQDSLDTSRHNCSPSGLDEPSSMFIVGDKLLVADSGNNRILIWNSVPKNINGQPADLVLGQQTMDRCTPNDDDQDGRVDRQPSARTLHYPMGIWSDGERLIVSDTDNGRVLIWNSFPSVDFAQADLVLGQPDYTTGEWPLELTAANFVPYIIWSNGLQLIVVDPEANRILVWDEFPKKTLSQQLLSWDNRIFLQADIQMKHLLEHFGSQLGWLFIAIS